MEWDKLSSVSLLLACGTALLLLQARTFSSMEVKIKQEADLLTLLCFLQDVGVCKVG